MEPLDERDLATSLPHSFVDYVLLTIIQHRNTYMWMRDKELGKAVIGIQSRACRVLLLLSFDLLSAFDDSLPLLIRSCMLTAAARIKIATTSADTPNTKAILPVSVVQVLAMSEAMAGISPSGRLKKWSQSKEREAGEAVVPASGCISADVSDEDQGTDAGMLVVGNFDDECDIETVNQSVDTKFTGHIRLNRKERRGT